MRPIDAHVGERVRARRIELRLSLETVAEAIGVHYQQVQRYESGSGRVPASRLWALSKVLGVRLDFFFDGYEEEDNTDFSSPTIEKPPSFLTDARSIRLARDFATLPEKEKRAVYSMVQALSSENNSALEE